MLFDVNVALLYVIFPRTDKVEQVILLLTFNELPKVELLDTNKVPIAFKFVPTVSEPDKNNDVPDILLVAKLPDTFNVDKTVSAPDTNNVDVVILYDDN